MQQLDKKRKEFFTELKKICEKYNVDSLECTFYFEDNEGRFDANSVFPEDQIHVIHYQINACEEIK